ncbi:hypothetical protein L7F22_068750 [Adiantum nelumboides]|nr:hypothetical protein [Adiantum nelumboides]
MNDDDPTWEIPVTEKKRFAMTNTQKKNKPHINEAKDNEEASGKAMAIEKKKLLEEVDVSKIASSSFKNVVNTRDDASDEEGEEEGAKDRGLFTIIEKSTLKWDLLDETMRRLENGYVPHRARFIVSLKTPQMATADVIELVSNNWDPIWMKLNEDFERQLEDSGGDVKGKMLYTWDGNHRLRAWNAEIDRAHKDDPSYHCCVGASMVDVTEENEGEVLTVVAQLNRINDKGYVRMSYIDMLCMAKYTKALQSIVSRWEEFTAEEFAAEYCNAFYTADKKRKNTRRAVAIADPSLGEEWWNLIVGLDWSKKPKWLTDDRLYTLACADLPNDHHSNVLTALSSNDPSSIYQP